MFKQENGVITVTLLEDPWTVNGKQDIQWETEPHVASEIRTIKVQGQSYKMKIKMRSGATQTNSINVAWSLNKYGRKKKEVDICRVFIFYFFLYKK